MTEILVILVVAMIFLGPDKLPETASKISKGIRDIRKQTRELTQTIENDTEIGGAIRDLKSALRGEDLRRPPVRKEPLPAAAAAVAPVLADGAAVGTPEVVASAPEPAAGTDAPSSGTAPTDLSGDGAAHPAEDVAASSPAAGSAPRALTLPATAGERSGSLSDEDDGELAKLIRPAAGTAQREGRRE